MVKITICYNKRNTNSDSSRIGNEKPESRQDMILAKLKYEICSRTIVEIPEISRTEINFSKNLLKITSTDFVSFLNNAYSSFKHANIPHSTREMYTTQYGGLVPYNFSKNQPDNSKINAYLGMAYYATDKNSPIFEKTHLIAINCLNTVEQAISLITHSNPIVYALTTYSGHNAGLNQYGKYSFFNNPVYGAYLMKERFGFNKIAILDIDYHHGNGSEELTSSDKNCLTISIHANPGQSYPGITGYDSETSNNLNITFQPMISIETYLIKLKKALDKIIKFGAEGVVVALGLNTLKDDSGRYFDMKFLPKHFLEIGKNISKTLYQNSMMKVLITQEGGDNLEKVPESVSNFLKGFENGYQTR